MKKGKKNRVIKKIGITAVLVIAMAAALFGKYEYESKYKIELIDSSVSGDGNHELLFQSVGEADWPFGATHARFVLKNNGRDVAVYKFDVANDGKTLCAGNWQVTWTDGSAEVLINGEEQGDILYSLAFDGSVKISSGRQAQ